MKIELEKERDYRRWSLELHPWLEKSVAAVFCAAIGGGSAVAVVAGVARLFGS